DFPYPESGKAQFFFLAYDGPTLYITDEASIMSGKDDFGELYRAGQDLLTQLRLTQEDINK
ncbi:MAG: hypothetical protein M5U15_15475, partial [Kiritimatiellae bacterium]|nr:hypothetical protein [Kiritimatiellia bacterium]